MSESQASVAEPKAPSIFDAVTLTDSVMVNDCPESTEFNLHCLIGQAIETLIDIECGKTSAYQVRAAVIGLECAMVLSDRLLCMADSVVAAEREARRKEKASG